MGEETQLRKRQQENLDDLQNEIAGRDVGRQIRFGHIENIRGSEAREKRSRRFEDTLTALQQFLQNPAYVIAREEFGDFLHHVQSVAETALETALRANQQAQSDLHTTLDQANRLPDGRYVFKDHKGDVFTRDGKRVSEEEKASIVWQEGAPSYEEYLTLKRQADKTQRTLEELELYQRDVLGPAKDRFDDEDNPMTLEEFDEYRKHIEDNMPPVVKQGLNAELEAQDKSFTPSSAIQIPNL